MVVNDLGRGWRDCWDGERDRYYKDCYCKRIRMLPGVLSLKKWGVLFVPGGGSTFSLKDDLLHRLKD